MNSVSHDNANLGKYPLISGELLGRKRITGGFQFVDTLDEIQEGLGRPRIIIVPDMEIGIGTFEFMRTRYPKEFLYISAPSLAISSVNSMAEFEMKPIESVLNKVILRYGATNFVTLNGEFGHAALGSAQRIRCLIPAMVLDFEYRENLDISADINRDGELSNIQQLN